MRRALRILATVLIAAGVLLLADGAATLLWKEPVSSLYARVQQGRLDDRLALLERRGPSPVERRVLARLVEPERRLRFAARAAPRRA
jgi:sortase A